MHTPCTVLRLMEGETQCRHVLWGRNALC